MKIKVVTLTGAWQYPLYVQDAETFDTTVPAVAPLVKQVAGDLTVTGTNSSSVSAVTGANRVGSPNTFNLLKVNPIDMTDASTIAESYHEPVTTAWSGLADQEVSVEARSTYAKIKAIAGFNPVMTDIFLQVWSFPVTAAGAITTGTLSVAPAANTGATLLFSQSLFANLQYKFDLEWGLVVQNCVIALSASERTFVHPTGSYPTVQVEVEETNPNPV